MTRVGLAVTRERKGRRLEYGIFEFEPGGDRYVRFEGHREGGWKVGLPSAGPGAWWNQPLVDFHPTEFERVTIF